MATGLWVKTIRHHRTDRQATVPCARGDAHAALREACHELDLPEPIWLEKNIKDFKRSSRCRFTQDSFLEPLDYDYLEMIVLEEDM